MHGPERSDTDGVYRDEDGTIRVGSTRVTFDTVVHAFRSGLDPLEIARRYPSLKGPEVDAAIAYYHRHREDVDRYLDQGLRDADELRARIRARQGTDGLRDELLARRKSQAPDTCDSSPTKTSTTQFSRA